jgi:hypothetical protein
VLNRHIVSIGSKLSLHSFKRRPTDDQRVDCNDCPQLVEGHWFISHCAECYDNKTTFCQARSHCLEQDDSIMSTKCISSANPNLSKSCDAEGCGKKISGLYFRELSRELLFSKQLAYLLIDCCECDEDDYDLCLQCAMGGRTCHDISHVLSPSVRPIERVQ